jgi:sugar lactone lactonase YvrE
LYYCPLASRRIYGVSLDALADPKMPDDQVAQTIKELPRRDFASDGLVCGPDGTLYLTDYENNAIHRFDKESGRYAIFCADPRMIWPDSMHVTDDGYLYFTANQLNRQPRFHEGKDQRQPPYVVFRAPLRGGGAAPPTTAPVAAR